MAIFPYKKNYAVSDDAVVKLKIKFPDAGTAGYHSIDIPGPDDKEAYNECEIPLGTGKQLKKERTIIFSKVSNMNINVETVRINYFLNDVLILEHTNTKQIDYSPMIKLTINFIDHE